MASPAQFIHLRSIHFSGIPNRTMIRARAVTGFALHSRFRWRDREIPGQAQRPRRMALKATQDRGCGIQRPVAFAFGVAMARRQRQLSCRAIETQPVFDVKILAVAADERHGLCTRPERPLSRNPGGKRGSQRMVAQKKQRPGMPGLRMLQRLRRMTLGAGVGPCKLLARGCDAPGQQSCQCNCESRYQTSLPLN